MPVQTSVWYGSHLKGHVNRTLACSVNMNPKTLQMWCIQCCWNDFILIFVLTTPLIHTFMSFFLHSTHPPLFMSFFISHYSILFSYCPSIFLILLACRFVVLPPSNRPFITLKVRLVPVSFEDPDFLASYEQSAALYARYQMTVHGDAPYECGESEVQTETCHIHNYMKHSTGWPEALLTNSQIYMYFPRTH